MMSLWRRSKPTLVGFVSNYEVSLSGHYLVMMFGWAVDCLFPSTEESLARVEMTPAKLFQVHGAAGLSDLEAAAEASQRVGKVFKFFRGLL